MFYKLLLTHMMTGIFAITIAFGQDGEAQDPNIQQNPVPQSQVTSGQSLDVGFTEHTGNYLSKDIQLINESDSVVTLGDLIDRPTVLNFVYYDCPGLCTPLMNEMSRLVNKMSLVLGKDYQVLTVSFDPAETTQLARQKKSNIISTLDHKERAKEGWKFFTGDSAEISRLTQEAGFHYKPQGQDYVHSGGFIAVSPEGKITRYLKGTSFLPFEMKMSMIEASEGEVGPPVNKVLQYCFAYDPEGQRYVADITKISGILIIFFSLVLFGILVIRSNLKRRKAKTNPQ